MIGLFITGTDTGVGKTVVAGALAAYLRERGLRVGVMKPAETGCRDRGGELVPSDAEYLKKVSGTEAPIELICPYVFSEPLAPAVAAERVGVKVDVRIIKKAFGLISSMHDVTLVEGAGGLMTPLYKKYLYLDLAAWLGLPVVIVGRTGLGTINHTLLTVSAARARGLEIYAIILNQGGKAKADAASLTNPAVVRGLSGIRRVLTLPYAPGVKNRPGAIHGLGKELNSLGFFDLTKKNSLAIISRNLK